MLCCAVQGSREAAERQERLIAQVEERRKLRATVVPTDVAEVKLLLRRLGEPITLFGERPVRTPPPSLPRNVWLMGAWAALK